METTKVAISCKTKKEFFRIIDIYEMDDEYMNWSFYGQNTVLYLDSNQYASVQFARDEGREIIKSETILNPTE